MILTVTLLAILSLILDGSMHRRYFKYVLKRGYAKRLVQAHKLRHATQSKEGGGCGCS